MYYEEKLINGVWYIKAKPNGEWVRKINQRAMVV